MSPITRRFGLWCGGVLLLACCFGWQLYRGLEIDTNVLSLLPATEQDQVVEDAIRRFTEHVGQKTIFLFGHQDPSEARKAARAHLAVLRRSEAFSAITFQIPRAQQRAFWELYRPYREQLLSAELLARFRRKDGAARHIKSLLRWLHSPMSGVVSGQLVEDPLLLSFSHLRGLPKSPGSLRLVGSMMSASVEGKTYLFAAVESKGSPFSRATQKQLHRLLGEARQAMKAAVPEATLLSTGAIYFAQAGGRSAEREISTIGVGSLLGLLFLLLVTFRSLRPLLLGGLPLAVGFVAAWTTCQWAFGRIHLLTLVFGASLIGVCVDYAFHYFSEQRMAEASWDPMQGLRHIFPGVTLGALTSMIGYLGLMVAPFPGLRQMALFSCVGLLGAYLTVLYGYPLLMGGSGAGQKAPFFLPWAQRLLALWEGLRRRGKLRGLLLGVGLLIAPGLWMLSPDDDVRHLLHAPPGLVKTDEKVRSIIGSFDSSRFFLVEGKSPEQVLQREEALRLHLDRLKAEKKLGFYQALTPFLPSYRSQREARRLLQRAFPKSEQGKLLGLGFRPASVAKAWGRLHGEFRPGLELSSWLAHRASRPLRHLWLGKTRRGFASIVLLGQVRQESAFEALEAPKQGLHYVNKVAAVSSLMKRYRSLASKLVFVAYVLIFLVLVGRYGWARGARIMAPPVLAAGLALATVGYAQMGLNLFHVLALLLVLGIGIDYTIFFAEASPKQARNSTLLAVLLSACTTLLSFGLLALSETPLLRSFGMIVLVGISAGFLTSPLALPDDGEPNAPP